MNYINKKIPVSLIIAIIPLLILYKLLSADHSVSDKPDVADYICENTPKKIVDYIRTNISSTRIGQISRTEKVNEESQFIIMKIFLNTSDCVGGVCKSQIFFTHTTSDNKSICEHTMTTYLPKDSFINSSIVSNKRDIYSLDCVFYYNGFCIKIKDSLK